MMATQGNGIPVLCVDDNPHVIDALRLKLLHSDTFSWHGGVLEIEDFLPALREAPPEIALLDLDMPGRSVFEVLAEALEEFPDMRVVVFSAHVRADLIDKALEAGAWGYASKNDGEDALLEVLEGVLEGEVAFSPEVRGTYDSN